MSAWFSYLRDAYHIFDYSFAFIDISSSRRKKVMDRIFKKLNASHSSQEEIKDIQLRLCKKKFTTKSKERKSWVVEVLLCNTKKVFLVSSFYEPFLPVFKSFIVFSVSQTKVKSSVLGKCSKRKLLMNLQITDDNILSKSMFFVGQKCKEDSSVIKIGRWGCHRISDTCCYSTQNMWPVCPNKAATV